MKPIFQLTVVGESVLQSSLIRRKKYASSGSSFFDGLKVDRLDTALQTLPRVKTNQKNFNKRTHDAGDLRSSLSVLGETVVLVGPAVISFLIAAKSLDPDSNLCLSDSKST